MLTAHIAMERRRQHASVTADAGLHLGSRHLKGRRGQGLIMTGCSSQSASPLLVSRQLADGLRSYVVLQCAGGQAVKDVGVTVLRRSQAGDDFDMLLLGRGLAGGGHVQV